MAEGLQEEDTNTHIINFPNICNTFKIRGASDDAMRFRPFPLSLKGRGKNWLNSLERIYKYLEAMTQKFLNKYFLPSKSATLHMDISFFV